MPGAVCNGKVFRGGCRSYLEDGHHEAVRHDLAVALSSILQEGEDSPAQIHGWDKQMHGDPREEVDERQEAQDVADDEDGLELDELVSVKAKVVRHARDVGIIFMRAVSNFSTASSVLKLATELAVGLTDIRLVDVLDPIQHKCIWND